MAQHPKCLIEQIFLIGLHVAIVHTLHYSTRFNCICYCSACLVFKYSPAIEENALVLSELQDITSNLANIQTVISCFWNAISYAVIVKYQIFGSELDSFSFEHSFYLFLFLFLFIGLM